MEKVEYPVKIMRKHQPTLKLIFQTPSQHLIHQILMISLYQTTSSKKKKKHPDCSGLVRLKKLTSPVKKPLKNHAEVVRFSGTPVASGKTWLNLADGWYFISSIMEVTLIIMKMKTMILAWVSIIIILPLLAEIIHHHYSHHVIHIHHSYKMLTQA